MKSAADVIITIRVLMVGKEIGAIIGKGGSTIASFRQQSGAKINISTAQVIPERIVTITGDQSQIRETFRLVSEKLDADMNSGISTSVSDKVPVTLKLIVPASQCGSIIGKSGSKIKEIRDSSACAIQVQSEMLPNSTERTVTLSGSPASIVHCVDMLCDVMIQFPARTATVPYKPQASNSPVIFHQGQAYILQGQFAVPTPDITKLHQLAALHNPGNGGLMDSFDHLRQCSGSSLSDRICVEKGSSGSVNLPTKVIDADTQEVTVSNEVIGCIIGKGGSRINEIRSMSGAQISIDRSTEKDSKKERKITINGSPESISMAQYLINTSIQVFSHQNKPSKSGSGEASSSSTPQPLMSLPTCPSSKPIPIAQLLGPGTFGGYMGPGPFSNPLGGGGLAGAFPGMGAGAFGAALQSARRTFMSRSRYTGAAYTTNKPRPSQNRRSKEEESQGGTGGNSRESSPNGKEKKKAKREKFQPY